MVKVNLQQMVRAHPQMTQLNLPQMALLQKLKLKQSLTNRVRILLLTSQKQLKVQKRTQPMLNLRRSKRVNQTHQLTADLKNLLQPTAEQQRTKMVNQNLQRMESPQLQKKVNLQLQRRVNLQLPQKKNQQHRKRVRR